MISGTHNRRVRRDYHLAEVLPSTTLAGASAVGKVHRGLSNCCNLRGSWRIAGVTL